MSYSANSSDNQGESWSQWGNGIFSQEKVVFKSNIPLVLSTSLTCAVYSYTMIDGSTNNAVNRALIMALSTFLGASAVNMLENNGYLGAQGHSARYVEGALIPLIYYGITKRQFELPELTSESLKTGILSSVVGELANPMVTKYYDRWDTPKHHSSSSASCKSSQCNDHDVDDSPSQVSTK